MKGNSGPTRRTRVGGAACLRAGGLLAAGAALLVLGTCSPNGAWDLLAIRTLARYPEYDRAMPLTLDNTGQSEDLADFPLLVTLTPERFEYPSAAPGGADLRFVTADGSTTLAHEIEAWHDGGTSWVWVKVPLVAGGRTTEIELLYDGPTGAVPESPAELWKDYELVYHLDDPTLDSGPNASTGILVGVPSSTTGRIARAVQVSSGGDHIDTNYVGAAVLRDRWTVESWVKANAGPTSTAITGPVIGGDTFNLSWDHSIANVRGAAYANDGLQLRGAKFGNPGGSTWYYLVGVYDGSIPNLKAYRDGAWVEPANTEIGNPLVQSVATTLIGTLDGVVDEVRVSAKVRSADWIKAQYLSMTDALVSYGPTLTR